MNMLKLGSTLGISVPVLTRGVLKYPRLPARTTVTNIDHDDAINGEPYPANVKKAQQLSGVRILDMTRVLAGPYCTMILGDLGAEVIKIEKPGIGDDTRSWGPPFLGNESVYFLSINRNKKSVAVNMKTSAGKEIIQQLSKCCDVFVENYLPGKLNDIGLGYDTLSRLNPRLIYCSITGYGSHGPYAQRGGYDVVASAIGGLMHITGPENGDPCRVGVAMTDIATGLYAHGAIMAALLQREKTGVGQKIDCSLMSTQVAVLSHLAANYLNSGQIASRLGSGHTSIVPYQAFKTSDGDLVVGAGNDKHFKILCKVLNLEYLTEDSSYAHNKDRVENRDELLKVLKDRFKQKSTDDWLKLLEGTGLPYGPINNMEQVFNDPQVKYRNLVQTIRHRTAGKISVVGPAVEYDGLPQVAKPSPPPPLGEHTVDVLKDVLGYSTETIKSLHDNGAIACVLQS